MAYLLRKGFSFEDIRSAMGAFEGGIASDIVTFSQLC